MAVKTYLYRGEFLTAAQVAKLLAIGAAPSVGALTFAGMLPITVDEAHKSDLDDAMASLGFTFIAERTGAAATTRRDYGVLAADPATPAPTAGDTYFNSTTGLPRVYDGVAWQNTGATANTSNWIWGNVVRVDSVNGNNATGARGGKPFLTVQAALAVAVAGDVVWIGPGTYTPAAGLVPAAGVSLRGLDRTNCVIEMAGVVADTVLLTMAENSLVADLRLNLSSAQHHTLTGVLFTGTTSDTSALRDCALYVDNDGAGVGVSNVYGIHATGSGVETREIVAVRDCRIVVESVGTGNKRGVLVDTAAQTFNLTGTTIEVERADLAAGSYVGIETNFAGVVCSFLFGSADGDEGSAVGNDIRQTLGTIAITPSSLENRTAAGLGFESTAAPSPVFLSDSGAVVAGTRYLRVGTAGASVAEVSYAINGTLLGQKLSCRLGTAIVPVAGTITVTLRKNGVDTGIAVTFTQGQVSRSISTVSVRFVDTDIFSVSVVATAGSGAVDLSAQMEFF